MTMTCDIREWARCATGGTCACEQRGTLSPADVHSQPAADARMADWTPEALAAEGEHRYAYEAAGRCPDSGLTIAACWEGDLCDCSMAPPRRCDFCGVKVWDIEDHRARQQCSRPTEDAPA